jgi:hypothetical protein
MMTSTDQVAALRRQVAEVTAERDALAAQLAGDLPAATAWLQAKVWRQRAVLDGLNRRIVTQRFALRLYQAVRVPVTAGEWAQARAALRDEQFRGRITETVPAVG